MKGKLYGIGAGPGDPELLTIKAVNTIQKCDVIAVPITGNGERTAFCIIEKYLAEKELLECRFAMEHNMAKRREARQRAASDIMRFLDDGKNVGFVTLGDPATYSTYMYVHQIIVSQGVDAEIIPGITSYAAAAAAFGVALCEGSETLTIIPASYDANIDELLSRPGNKVIMKSGGNLTQVLEKLKQCSYGERTKIACRCTMDGQRLFNSIDDYEKSPESGYFTIAIVKEKS
ncbi:MAG: precorrin-2 C(20)-methyltransferase [Treponema sp.]|jgi:precorrin-2/cobalt-factor-2 C20-methyltransferase|nr:precorrin-2 C(20)-methyltransferase [Treponema sp.]